MRRRRPAGSATARCTDRTAAREGTARSEEYSLFAAFLFKPLAELGDAFGIDLAGFDEAHHQLVCGAAEHAIDEVADGVAGGFVFSDSGAVDVGAATQFAAELSFALEDVEHGLDGGVGQLLRKALLH